MPGKKGEVWVKGKATSQHCIVQNKGQKGVGLILEEKKIVCRLHSQLDSGRKAKIQCLNTYTVQNPDSVLFAVSLFS